MSKLSVFLKDFYKNHGMLVFLSFLIQKITAFAITLILVRLLTKEEFGLLSIVPATFALFATFTGFGLPVALLRYGSILKKDEEKEAFSTQIFHKSIFYQGILGLVFFFTGFFFITKYAGILVIFVAFALRLFGTLFLSYLQVYYRIQFNNRKFALITIYNAVFGFLLVSLSTYIFGFYGYLVSVSISPYLALLWFKKKMFRHTISSFVFFSRKEIMRFSAHSSFTNFTSELFFSMDILLLSYYLSESSIAGYRVAILIPSNMIFLAQSFVQSDYAKLASNSGNYHFLKNYMIQFFKIFAPICIGIFACFYFFRKPIIDIFFGEQYQNVEYYFLLLSISSCINMLFRVLFGNLLSAIGKMNLVTYATSFSVISLIICSVFLVPTFGVLGMVYSVLFSMVFCASFLGICFLRALNN